MLTLACRIVAPVLAVASVLAAQTPAPSKPPATKLDLHKWSGELNVPDPVACTVDNLGRVYVTQTTRRKVGDLDIREHTQWIPNDVALESVEQKKAFFHEVLAPGKMLRPEGSLKDHNGDGSIDWKDLTVHTERIYRLEDSDHDGTADKMTVFAEGFDTEVTGIAAGILWHDGWVYCTIAPDLWRLRDTNDDGVADEREVVAHGFGHHIAYAGHDMHGPRVGPDGRIYWTIGDKGVNVTTKEGKRVAKPHEGCLLRCEPDGSHFEIFAHGLRNVQEIAFDEQGDVFGVDNDADKPGEKERLVYIAEHSDSGWRCSYQYMKGYVPWVNEGLWQPRHEGQPEYITPPLANSHDGPAGFAYEPGTALGSAWRQTFFLNQFPSGKMNAIKVKSSGAGFEMTEDKLVASGVMGIGMSWGSDGKIYMADWGGDYALNEIGAVWTVDDATGIGSSERQEVAGILKAGFAKRDVGELVSLLGHADMRVRQESQFELVKRGAFAELERVAQSVESSKYARYHAIWGLGQGLRSGAVKADGGVFAKLLADKNSEVRAQAAKILGDSPEGGKFGSALIGLLADKDARVRMRAAISIGKLEVPGALDALRKMAVENGDVDVFLRHGVVVGLAGSATSEDLIKSKDDSSRAVRVAAVLALRRKLDPGITEFLSDKDDSVAAEAARGIHDDESITASMPTLAALLDGDRVYAEAVTRRALNASYRIGDATNAKRVIDYALNATAPLTLRLEALNLAKLWSKPPMLDRVDGRARPLGERPQVMADVARPELEALMALQPKELKAEAISILTAYQLPVSAKLAQAAVEEAGAPELVRVEALRLLENQHPASPELLKVLDGLLNGKTTPVLRVAALEMAVKATPDKAVEAAVKLISKGATLEKQKAVSVLAAVKLPEADEILTAQLKLLLAGKSAASAQLDLLEAAEARGKEVPTLGDMVAAYRSKHIDGLAAFAECLEGGDSSAGKELALENLMANCTACHRFDKKEGSNVGPVLSSIGAEKDKSYLLEALVAPNAKLAEGYGLISIVTRKGENLAGGFLSINDQQLKLRMADGKVVAVPVMDIASKTEPVSVMPPMNVILTKRQIRDVVAYLASLKSGSNKKKTAPAEH